MDAETPDIKPDPAPEPVSPHLRLGEYQPKWTNRRRAVFLSIGISGFVALSSAFRLAIASLWVPVPVAEVGGLCIAFLGSLGHLAYVVDRYVFGANSALAEFYKLLQGIAPGDGQGGA